MDIKINHPSVTPAGVKKAVEVLEICRQSPLPEFGFDYEFFSPGGDYGYMWWQLDFSLALTGYLWLDQQFCEKSLLNFCKAQKSNGRIPLWGNDLTPGTPLHSRQRENVSSLPKLFDAAWQITRRTNDLAMVRKIYPVLVNYLNWFFVERQDPETKLISGVFEETFVPYLGYAGEIAPVDTNVELAHGCGCVAQIAARLGDLGQETFLLDKQRQIMQAVRQYLWDDRRKAFYNYTLKDGSHVDTLMVSTFFPMRLNMADAGQKQHLLRLLTDPARFNWGKIPLNSVDQQDRTFTITDGKYQGNPSWSGSIWSILNEQAVRALIDAGELALAAELADRTVAAFDNNYSEFLNPETGRGNGVPDYAWTAAQYLEILLKFIFGIDYAAPSGEIAISPMVSARHHGKVIEVSGINIPGAGELAVKVKLQAEPVIEAVLKTGGKEKTFTGANSLVIRM